RQSLEPCGGPICSRKRLAPVREHALSIRLRKHAAENRWPAETPDGLLYGRTHGFHPRPAVYATWHRHARRLRRDLHSGGVRHAREAAHVFLALPRPPGIGGRHLLRLQRRRGLRKELETRLWS